MPNVRLHFYSTLLLLTLGGSLGCTPAPPEGEFLARVGGAVLRDADLAERMGGAYADSTLREHAVRAWVEHQLLLQDAEQQGLERLPEVARLLREHREAMLIASLAEEIVRQRIPPAEDTTLSQIFSQDRDSYRLSETFVRFRYASSPRQSVTLAARRDLMRAPQSDTLWNSLRRRSDFRATLDSAHAQQRLFAEQPALRDAIQGLRPGQTSALIEAEGRFHVLHVLEIRAAGAYPEPAWIRPILEQRYIVMERQHLLARYVERLRAEAEARNAITLNIPPAP
jgi:hypothetical protein